MKRLGMITVGQAPRSDVVPGMRELLGPDVEILERGALDSLNQEEIRALAPTPDQTILCTRLKNGGQVTISKEGVTPLVQEKVLELNRLGVDMILLLCTGHFGEFASDCLVLSSQRIVDHSLEAVLGPKRRLGLMVPLATQKDSVSTHLAHITSDIVVESASPYGNEKDLHRAAGELGGKSPDLVVLHCMGYTRSHGRIVRQSTGRPVMVASAMVARTLAEMLVG